MDITHITEKIQNIYQRISNIEAKFLTKTSHREVSQTKKDSSPKNENDSIKKVNKEYTFTKLNSNLEKTIEKISAQEEISSNLVKALISAESNFNPYAVSPKGAMGLMQLMPETAKMLKVNNPFDIEENIRAGVQYLKQIANKYNNLDLILAAYNAGPGNVDKYKSVPPFLETKNYIKKIKQILNTLEN